MGGANSGFGHEPHCTRLEHASLDLNSLHIFKDWIAKSYCFKTALSHEGGCRCGNIRAFI